MWRLFIASLAIVLQFCGDRAQGDDSTVPAVAPPRKAPAVITEAPAMPSARGSHAGAMLDEGVVVVAGGSAWPQDRSKKIFLSDTLIFDAGKWRFGPDLPHPTAEAAFASDGERLYLLGGLAGLDSPTADVLALSLGRDRKLQIEPLPQLPFQHYGGGAAVLNGRLFIAAGYADGQVTNGVWMLELSQSNATWVMRSPIPAGARAYPALVAAGGQLYLLGGMTTDGEIMRVFKDVFQYDVEANAWKHLGELPAAGYCWAATRLDSDGHQLLVGGRADGAIHDDLWIVDLTDLSVRGIGRTVITTTCAPLVQIDARTFWLIGGEPDSNKTRTARVTQVRLP